MGTRLQGTVLSILLLGVSACSGGGGTEPQPTTGSISGRVTAGSSNVAGVAIALTGGVGRNTTTDGSGQFAFADLSPGGFTVALTLPEGFRLAPNETLSKSATVAAGQTTTVDWGLEQDASEDVQEIRLSGVSFSPSEVTISVGTTVRWVVDAGTHTVTPDNPDQPGAWTGTGNLDSGQSFSYTFSQAGTYDYHCAPHRSQGMTGRIRVE